MTKVSRQPPRSRMTLVVRFLHNPKTEQLRDAATSSHHERRRPLLPND
ncbi:hypothetical protein [Puniceicoccus vermicola]